MINRVGFNIVTWNILVITLQRVNNHAWPHANWNNETM